MTYNGGMVVTEVGGQPTIYIASGNGVNFLDLQSLLPAVNVSERTHAFSGDEKTRDKRKRAKRFLLFGSGNITSGTITLSVDGVIKETYPVTSQQAVPGEGILIKQEWLPSSAGREMDVTYTINGTDLVITNRQLIFVTLG